MSLDNIFSDKKINRLRELQQYSQLRKYIKTQYSATCKQIGFHSMTDDVLERLLGGMKIYDCPACYTHNLYLVDSLTNTTDLYRCDWCKETFEDFDPVKTPIVKRL